MLRHSGPSCTKPGRCSQAHVCIHTRLPHPLSPGRSSAVPVGRDERTFIHPQPDFPAPHLRLSFSYLLPVWALSLGVHSFLSPCPQVPGWFLSSLAAVFALWNYCCFISPSFVPTAVCLHPHPGWSDSPTPPLLTPVSVSSSHSWSLLPLVPALPHHSHSVATSVAL